MIETLEEQKVYQADLAEYLVLVNKANASTGMAVSDKLRLESLHCSEQGVKFIERSFGTKLHPEARYYNNAWTKGKFFCPEKFCEASPSLTDTCLLNKALYLTVWNLINIVNHEVTTGLFPNGLDINSLFREGLKKSDNIAAPNFKVRALLHYMNLESATSKKMGGKWGKFLSLNRN